MTSQNKENKKKISKEKDGKEAKQPEITKGVKEDHNNDDLIIGYKEEIHDLNEKLLRAAAEGENIRNRYEKQLEETRSYAVSNFAKDMLGVLDNLSRALEYVQQDLGAEEQSFVEGVKMTKAELLKTLSKNGIEAISPQIGDKFDYNFHHAISQVKESGKENGCILAVMQEGYKMQDRLLRPASVAVAKE